MLFSGRQLSYHPVQVRRDYTLSPSDVAVFPFRRMQFVAIDFAEAHGRRIMFHREA